MSLELLLQASLPSKIEESKQVSPTLALGLGGTGKEVLLRLRRLLVERYGSLDALPFLQFLHLDTDGTTVAREQYDLKAGDDPLYEKIRFSPAERVDLTIEGGTGRYIDHINTYPHIKRWFQTDGKIAGLGNLGEGAGQIRMASRLGFYHDANFKAIAAQLERARGALKDAANPQRAREYGFDLDASHINLFVVASVAGGTGGGTFLDMGFLLQRYFPSADRVGILILPNFFRGYAGAQRARANGFASLTELNHYSFGHHFVGNWDGVNHQLLAPPPFSTTYLIDASNEAGLVIGSSGKEYDVYRMCAEYLFQDFSVSSFAGMKRAIRVNLVNFNLNVYTHNFLNEALSKESSSGRKSVVGDTFPTRFGSFGLASIAFPTDRVHSACACRLARGILEFWEKTLLDDPLEKLFTAFLNQPEVSFVQGRYERRDGGGSIDGRQVEDVLLLYDRDSSRTFQALIWEKAQNIRGEIEAAPNREKAALLGRYLDEFDQALAREDSTDRDEWGVWVRTIESNMRTYLTGLKRGITQRARELADNPKYGVAYTLSLLRELKALLRNGNYFYLDYFSESIAVWVDETQRYDSEVSQLRSEIARHERSILFRSQDLERDLNLLVAPDDQEEDLGALYNFLYARVMKQVMKRGHQICREIDEMLGKDDPTGKGLIAEYYQLLLGFRQLKDRLMHKESYFSRPEKSELIISLYQDGDVDRWYQTWVGGPHGEEEVRKRVGNQMLSEVFEVASVTQALDHIQSTPADVIEDKMLAHCKKFFAGRDEQPEALAMLMDTNRFSSREREEKVRLAYRLAKVWVAPPEGGLDHIPSQRVAADQRPCLIGVDRSDNRRVTEFEKLIRERIQAGADSPPAFKSIGESYKGMIVFYNELAGVTAFYPSSVLAPQGLKEAYESYQDKDELHSDKNRFQFGDLIPKRPQETTRYVEALQAFVLGRLLGLLRVKETSSRTAEQPIFSYSFKRHRGLSVEEISLGEEMHAIDALYRDLREGRDSDRRYLLDQIDETIHRLQVLRHLEVYALLLEFYMKVVYAPTEADLKEASVTLVSYSPTYAVLDVARTRLQRLVGSEDEEKRLRESLIRLRGKGLDKPLTYEEYAEALRPYVKTAGKVTVLDDSSVGVERYKYKYPEVFALDLATIDTSIPMETVSPPPPPKAPAPTREAVPQRPCPHCGGAIDSRALKCRHCKQTVAEGHITCPNCDEHRVPSDLEVCWRCGKVLPGRGEIIECPICFSFAGTADQFPCPECGHDLNAPPAEPAREEPPTETGTGSPRRDREEAREAEASAPEEASSTEEEAAPAEEVPPAPAKVQCPTCYEEVEPGPKCSVCGSLLP